MIEGGLMSTLTSFIENIQMYFFNGEVFLNASVLLPQEWHREESSPARPGSHKRRGSG